MKSRIDNTTCLFRLLSTSAKRYVLFLFVLIVSILSSGCVKEVRRNMRPEDHYEIQNDSQDVPNNVSSEYCNIEDLLKLWEKGMEDKDLEIYLNVFDDEMRHSLEVNLEKDKSLPFYSTDSLTIKNIKRLSQDDLMRVYPIYVNEDLQYEIYYFYYEAKVKEKMETKYNKNGENFIICVITKQNGEWKISQFSCAPEATLLLKKEINLGSSTEAELLTKAKDDIGIKSLLSVSEPTSIRVQMRSELVYNGETNYEYWGVEDGEVKSINFQGYIKDVLPNEWDCDIVGPDKDDEDTQLYWSLCAGALMVKGFGWYHTINPWNPSIGADVNDQYSQVYLHGTKYKSAQDGLGQYFSWGVMCQDAFSATDDMVLWNSNTDDPVWTHYEQGAIEETYALDGVNGLTPDEIVVFIYLDFYYEYDWGDLYYEYY